MTTALADEVDVLTGRALRYALEPGADLGRAAVGLAEFAHGEASMLRQAIGRLERELGRQPSGAGQRVRTLLERALTLVYSSGTTVMVPVYPTSQKATADGRTLVAAALPTARPRTGGCRTTIDTRRTR